MPQTTTTDKRDRKDSGIITLALVLGLPMIWLIILTVLNTGLLAYTNQAIKSETQSAVIAGATKVNQNGRINPTEGRRAAIEIYSKNRAKHGQILCLTSRDVKPGEELILDSNGCGWVLTNINVSSNGRNITMSVREKMKAVGIPSNIKDHFTVTARVTATVEKR